MIDYNSTVIDRNQPLCRLIEYRKCVYKFKILFGDNVAQVEDDLINQDVELVIRAILSQVERQAPLLKTIETANFIFRCSKYKWGIADKFAFVDRGVPLTNHSRMYVLDVSGKPDNHAVASHMLPVINDVEEIVDVEVNKHRVRTPGRDDNVDDQGSVSDRLEDEDIANPSSRSLLDQEHGTNDDAQVPEIGQHCLDSVPGQTSYAQAVPRNHLAGSVQISCAPSHTVNSMQTCRAQKVAKDSTTLGEPSVFVSDLVMSRTRIQTVQPPPILSFLSDNNVASSSSQLDCIVMPSEPLDALPLFITMDTPSGQPLITEISETSTPQQLLPPDIDILATKTCTPQQFHPPDTDILALKELTPSHPLDILAMFQTVTPSYSPFIAPFSRCNAPPSVPLGTSSVSKKKLTPSSCSSSTSPLTPPHLAPPTCPRSTSPSSPSTPPNLPRIPPVLETLPTNRTDYSVKLQLKAGPRPHQHRNESNASNNCNGNIIPSSTDSPSTHCPPAMFRAGSSTSDKSTETQSKDGYKELGTIFHGTDDANNEDEEDDDECFEGSSSMSFTITPRRPLRSCQREGSVRRNTSDQRSDDESDDDRDSDEVKSGLMRPTSTQFSRDRFHDKIVTDDVDDESSNDGDGDHVSYGVSTRNVQCQTVGTGKKVSAAREVYSRGHVNVSSVGSAMNSNANKRAATPTESLSCPAVKRRSITEWIFNKIRF